jgi:hypothetical protein
MSKCLTALTRRRRSGSGVSGGRCPTTQLGKSVMLVSGGQAFALVTTNDRLRVTLMKNVRLG